jgi:hypothetical protein
VTLVDIGYIILAAGIVSIVVTGVMNLIFFVIDAE